jgi:hypothetical protein
MGDDVEKIFTLFFIIENFDGNFYDHENHAKNLRLLKGFQLKNFN